MNYLKKSLTIIIIGIILLGLVGCSKNVNNVEKDSQINLSKLDFTLPSNWSKRVDGNEVFFDDENNQTVGGISLAGYYGDYDSALPNHSETMSTEDIDTSLGKGKLYTLERSEPAASNNTKTWTEVHAIIPVVENKRAYDVWLMGQKDILLSILKSMHY